MAVLAIGCGNIAASNGGSGGTTSGTGGNAGAAGGTGGTGPTGGSGGATAQGGASGTGGAAGGDGGVQPDCYNGLTSTGNFVMSTPGSQGIAQGGVIADGIYDLTAAYYAGPAVSDAPWQSATIRVTGNTMDTVSMLRTDPAPTYRSYTFAMEGTALTWTTICGASRTRRGYTAMANTLQIMSNNVLGTTTWNNVDIYTKR